MIPPEALATDNFDHSFDIYQFGLTLYRMCNGDQHFYVQFAVYGPPDNFDRERFRFDVRNGRFPNRSSFLPHVPATLRNVIRKCLQIEPAQRYRSAIEVANAMAGIDGNSLDWQFLQQDDKKVWTKNEKGTEYELAVYLDGHSECYKTVNDGVRRRVAKACRKEISDKDLRKLFTDY
jgi:serine/threonine protein kinase